MSVEVFAVSPWSPPPGGEYAWLRAICPHLWEPQYEPKTCRLWTAEEYFDQHCQEAGWGVCVCVCVCVYVYRVRINVWLHDIHVHNSIITHSLCAVDIDFFWCGTKNATIYKLWFSLAYLSFHILWWCQLYNSCNIHTWHGNKTPCCSTLSPLV